MSRFVKYYSFIYSILSICFVFGINYTDWNLTELVLLLVSPMVARLDARFSIMGVGAIFGFISHSLEKTFMIAG